MSSLKSRIGSHIVLTLFYLFRLFPVKNRKVYVNNFYGRGYGDSPKYMIDCLLKESKDYDIVWSVKGNREFPKGVRAVNTDTVVGFIKSIYEEATAKIWIDNSRKYRFERKRKGQYYIQTWHGDIFIKKIQGDIEEKMSKVEIEHAKNDSKMIDLFISGNKWFQDKCKQRFFYQGEIAACGLPRRDIFYSDNLLLREQIRKRLGIPKDVKVLLYVPTFRNEEIKYRHLGEHASHFDWSLIFSSLQERFGGKWNGLIRLHPNVAKYSNDLVLPYGVINVTNYDDISELMYISDVCISDYSSALFDFSITRKPGFIFAPDKDKYEDERGYLFSEDVLPFTVAKDINELEKNIRSFDVELFLDKCSQFYTDILHVYEDGHASEFLVKRIVKICENSH